MNSFRLIVFFSAALVACSSPPSSTEPIPDAGTTQDAGTTPTEVGTEISDLCAELATVLCSETAECSCSGVSSATECVKEQQPLCERSFALPISGVALGRMRFEGAVASECVAAYAKALDNCADPSDSPYSNACGSMFSDLADIGAECHELNEGYGCADGAGLCGQDGRCVALPSVGEPCPFGRCSDNSVCRSGECVLASSLTDAPIGGVCSQRRDCALGLTCQGGTCVEGIALSETCDETEQCGKGLICQQSFDRTCRAKALEGERCLGDDCTQGLFCDYNETYPICRARVAEGESCAGGLECLSGLACSIDGLCVALPLVNESCVNSQCAEGAFCAPGDVCQALQAEGAVCYGQDAFCQPGFFCDLATQTCRATFAEGAECESSSSCGPDSECNASGKCEKMPVEVGAPCGFVCGGGLRCAPKPAQCVAGVCGVL